MKTCNTPPSALGLRARWAVFSLGLLLFVLATLLTQARSASEATHTLANASGFHDGSCLEEQVSPFRFADLLDKGERNRHLSLLGVDRWHAAGSRGSGVKVAVLDTGFRNYKDFLGQVLPEKVAVRSFRKDGNLEARDSQHGILCAEVIHAMAPASEMVFANWDPDDAESFLAAVRWAKQQGARVISCSVIMPSLSDGEGGGQIHEALTGVLGVGKTPEDMLLFASAGNTAERHWAGAFHNAAGYHEWSQGVVDNVLSPWGDERVSVELCCKQGSSYEVQVYDQGADKEIVHAGRSCPAGGSAVVRFNPEPGHDYRVRVRLTSGKAGPFHLTALHAGLRQTIAAGSVAFPGDGPEVIAVGAVNYKGQRTSYSACGSLGSRPKPDLVAPVPFLSAWRSRPFAGTSAAAPQAAAAAALLWSRHADWTAGRVRAELCQSAQDLGPVGHDPETGFGSVHLP